VIGTYIVTLLLTNLNVLSFSDTTNEYLANSQEVETSAMGRASLGTSYLDVFGSVTYTNLRLL